MPTGIYIRTKPVSEETRKKIGLAHKGKFVSLEAREKMSKAHIGQKSWNKGIPCTEKTKEKNRIAHLNLPSPNKGRKFSEIWKQNISKSHIGQKAWCKGMKIQTNTGRTHFKKDFIPWNKGLKLPPLSKEHRIKLSKLHRGINAYNYKGNTPLVRTIRTCFEYRQWRSDVFTRDDFTCQSCGIKGEKLEAHHIVAFADIIERYEILTLEDAINCAELWNINNGQTLCQECHKLTKNYRNKNPNIIL